MRNTGAVECVSICAVVFIRTDLSASVSGNTLETTRQDGIERATVMVVCKTR